MPITDTVLAGLFGIGALSAANDNSGVMDPAVMKDNTQQAGGATLMALGFGLSALYGYSTTAGAMDKPPRSQQPCFIRLTHLRGRRMRK